MSQYDKTTEALIERELKKECPKCGKLKSDVATRNDPYMEEVHHEIEPLLSCLDCFIQVAREI